MSDYLVKTLEYYFEDGSHVIFEKYTIDTLGIIRHRITGKTPSYNKGSYNVCGVYDNNGKRCGIRVARAVASTFLGKPPTFAHTADHVESNQKKNDALSNIRWLCQKGQKNNRSMPKSCKSALIIVRDGDEKTAKEWAVFINDAKMSEKIEYTANMINNYAILKQHGFAYKEYPDLEGEEWRVVENSKNCKDGSWKISNMNRVKYITKHAENVLWGERLSLSEGYPVIGINRKMQKCHILSFMAFHPDQWAAKKTEEIVLHEKDDKVDFRPHNLRLGTRSENFKDAHNNGKLDGTLSMRSKCASYIDGILEKEHESQTAAATYLKMKECSKASIMNIRSVICLALTDKRPSAYNRTWKRM
ncbi:hypothetical protein PBCVCan184_249L [Paramecium bursaria Chlorella virus Can18-4]|nr:hypothetical protein PBCVCan184_249L [Paramecium bursaria Chlorella virus Can18-4]